MWPLPELEGGQAVSGPHGVQLREILRAARGKPGARGAAGRHTAEHAAAPAEMRQKLILSPL